MHVVLQGFASISSCSLMMVVEHPLQKENILPMKLNMNKVGCNQLK
jgi:hypothetical protein